MGHTSSLNPCTTWRNPKNFVLSSPQIIYSSLEWTLSENDWVHPDWVKTDSDGLQWGLHEKKKKKNHMPDIMVWVTYNFISFSQEKIPKMLVMWFLLRSVPQRHVPLRPLGHLCSTTVLHLWQYVMTHFTFISCPAQIAICVHDPQRANHMTFLVAPPVDWHLWCWVEKDWWAQTVV